MAPPEPFRPSLLPSLYDPQSGRLDAEALAKELHLRVSDIAQAIGKNPAAVRKTPHSSSLQSDLAPIVDLVQRLHLLFQHNMGAVLIWLNAPNRGLDGEPPMRYLLSGRIKVLDALVGALEEGFTS